MNRFVMMVAAAEVLAVAAAAEKEAPIDWLARAATVKVGMTRAEVEKILPEWKSANAHPCVGTSAGWRYVYVTYPVSENWSVEANYCCPTNRWPINYTGTSKPSQAELLLDRLSEPIWVRKLVKQWPVVMVDSKVPINEAQAIAIATRYIKEYEPTFDISLRTTTAHFFASNFQRGMSEQGAWTVDFSIPPQAPYYRKECSYDLMIDRLGRVWGHLTGIYW